MQSDAIIHLRKRSFFKDLLIPLAILAIGFVIKINIAKFGLSENWSLALIIFGFVALFLLITIRVIIWILDLIDDIRNMKR